MHAMFDYYVNQPAKIIDTIYDQDTQHHQISLLHAHYQISLFNTRNHENFWLYLCQIWIIIEIHLLLRINIILVKMSRFNIQPTTNKRKDTHKMQQLIKELMKAWSNKGVEEKYQNYFLTYINSLPKHIVELQISREIKKTLQNRSHYFNISKSIALHNNTITKLKQAVQNDEQKQKIAQQDLQYICQLLDQLRSNNILVAENTLNFNYESRSKSNDQFGFVHGNNYIFQKIDNGHAFIKNSFLRKYIVFTHSYDPFFLHHYQSVKSTNDQKYRSLPCIEKLFNLSISKAYKAMKLQQQILSYLSGKVPIDRDQQKSKMTKGNDYKFLQDRRKQKTNAIGQEQNKGSIRLQNRSYMKKREEIESQEGPKIFRSNTDGDQQMNNYLDRYGQKQKRNRHHLPSIQRRQSFYAEDQRINNSSMVDNMLFKSRNRRNQNTSEEQNNSPVTLKKSQNFGNSTISAIKRRQDQSRSLLPNKYSKPQPIDDNILRVQEAEIEEIREQNDLRRDQVFQNKARNNQNFQNMNLIQPIPVSQPRSKLSSKRAVLLKNFKLKAGNITVHSLFVFLKELNIQENYRKLFEIGNWQHSIRNKQYYMHKHYINQVLMAVSLCCALPETDIIIKYWGPTMQCDEEISHFLFNKFLEHIERHTLCKVIYYNALQIPQVFASSFVKHKNRIYRRQRSIPSQIGIFSYYPFLSIDLSIISIPRSTPKEIQDKIIIISNKYSSFTEKQFACLNYLLIINRLINPGQFSNIGTYTSSLQNMRQVQTKMVKEKLTINPYNLDSKATPINLFTLQLRTPILSSFFIANNSLLKFTGQQLYRNNQNDSLIVALKMLKSNSRLIFGKGFISSSQMASILKKQSKSQKKIQFCVHMFGKRMRGKVMSINLRDQVCFGDLELVFQWKDFLKGRIEHKLQQLSTFGFNKQSFYCMVEIFNENIFTFQVNESNLI